MRILSVELTNFGPFHGTHEFNLADRGLLLVMGDNQDEPRMDSNGSGKSSVFDALDWCLWGENPRGDHAEAVFNDEVFSVRGSKCEVYVKLENDAGGIIDIIRTRTKSKLDLEVTAEGNTLSTLDTKESQKVIERILGLDREVFHAAVLFGQQDLTHYADSTDTQRMEILTRLLQLDDIDRYLERVKGMLRGNGERKAKLQVDLAGVNGQLQATRPEDLDAQVVQWEQTHQETLSRFQEAMKVKVAEHHEAQAQVVDPTALQAAKATLDKELAILVPPAEPPEVEAARQAAAKAQADMALAARDAVLAQDGMKALQGEGAICSRCRQPITDAHRDTEHRELLQDLQKAETIGQEAQARLYAAEAARAEAAEQGAQARRVWQVARDAKAQEAAHLGAQLQAMTAQVARVEALAREISGFQAELAKLQGETNPWTERRAKIEQERYDLERRLGQIQYELEALEVAARHLGFWIHGLGVKGLKSYILDSRLQELSDAANEWLHLLTGGTMWVRFEAQKETRGKKLVNAPDVRCFRWNPDGTITERSYKSWSGGEKKRISFAVDFGLSRLVARRATQRYDLLILDEAFKHLDRAGKEAVMEMLQKLSQEKSSLIVVEHDTEFQGQFERRVLVRKQNRRSTIQEVDHGNQKELPVHLPADTDSKRVPRREPVRRPAG
jgi:DNA repair exonuclease SbcCD ATPase subunit